MSNSNEMKTIGVVGAGTMGAGIVQVFAQNGFDVLAYDAFEGAVEQAAQRIEKILTRLVDKGKIEESAKRQAIDRIKPCGGLADFASADIAIRGGMLRTQNLAVVGPELRVLARGEVDLAREPHHSEFVLAFLFLETVDRVLGNVPVLGRLVLGPDRSLVTLYMKVDGPWADPNLRPLMPGAVETAAGWATRAIEGAVGRLRRIFRPRAPPRESGLGNHDARAR